MVTLDDIAGWIGGKLTALSAFTTAVPGGVWNVGADGSGGPDAPTAYPYATMRVTAREPKWNSGDLYTQAFTVRVAAYAPVGASGSDPQAVQTSIRTALQWATPAALRNATDRVLHVRPTEPAGTFDARRRAGRDVFVAGESFEVLVQGDRSVT